MNDLIFDALEYIDDDMIEDVDSIRTRKAQAPRRTWTRYVSAVACFCIILVGVFAASRYKAPERFGTEDTEPPTGMSGQGFVHSYVRAEISISESGAYPRTVTEIQKITVIYDVIKMIENSEASKLNSSDENEGNEDLLLKPPETNPKDVEVVQYTITLISSDGEKMYYTLVENILRSENTGRSYVLSDEHYTALIDLIN